MSTKFSHCSRSFLLKENKTLTISHRALSQFIAMLKLINCSPTVYVGQYYKGWILRIYIYLKVVLTLQRLHSAHFHPTVN